MPDQTKSGKLLPVQHIVLQSIRIVNEYTSRGRQRFATGFISRDQVGNNHDDTSIIIKGI